MKNSYFIIGCLLLVIILLLFQFIKNIKNDRIEGFTQDSSTILSCDYANPTCSIGNCSSINSNTTSISNGSAFTFNSSTYSHFFIVPNSYNSNIISTILKDTKIFYIDCSNILYYRNNNKNFKYVNDMSNNNNTKVVTFNQNSTDETFVKCLCSFVRDLQNAVITVPTLNFYFNYVSNTTVNTLGIIDTLKLIIIITLPTETITRTLIFNFNTNDIKLQILNTLKQNSLYSVNTSVSVTSITATQSSNTSTPSIKYNLTINKSDGTIDRLRNIEFNTIIINMIVIIASSGNLLPETFPGMDTIPRFDDILHSIYNSEKPNNPLYLKGGIDNDSINKRFISGYINYDGNNYPTIAEKQS